jgi:23S rRNA (adenine2503-C2)-methyltransferase
MAEATELMNEATGLTFEELEHWMGEHQIPRYRARQVWHWMYRKTVREWDAMRNLSAELRAQLAGEFRLRPAECRALEGISGETRKMLVGLADGEAVEAVLIPAADRVTVCVSSQVGCRFRCAFCASGQMGVSRNLTPGEMVGEVLLAIDQIGAHPDNVVFMGMGEPLDNYDALLKALRILNDGEGLAIGARRMTISTCGWVPGIERLKAEGLQVELSVSLHAPDDDLRSRLMPVNRRYPLASLMAACGDYSRVTGRIVTFEYTLIRGLNDRPDQAQAVVRWVRSIGGRVNLIPLSPVPEFSGEAPTPAAVEAFRTVLERGGINTTVRRSKGSEISAACGQLRRRVCGARGDAP